MDIEQFTPEKPGDLIPVTGICAQVTPFCPTSCHPNGTGRACGPYCSRPTRNWRAGCPAKHLPDPNLLLRPLQKREAQRSSKLEGTFTNPQQQMLFELEPVMPTSADDVVNAYREVANYATALRVGLQMIRGRCSFLAMVDPRTASHFDGWRAWL